MKKKNKRVDACLHCLTRRMWKAKWKTYSKQERDERAFDDLVHTTIKLAADCWAAMDTEGQMHMLKAIVGLGTMLAAKDAREAHDAPPKPTLN